MKSLDKDFPMTMSSSGNQRGRQVDNIFLQLGKMVVIFG